MDNRKRKQLRAQTFETINNLAATLPEEAQQDLDTQLSKLAEHIIKLRVKHDRKG
jgi:hypothetical protein